MTTMESMGGIPSGESCIVMVREEDVERMEEMVGAPGEMHAFGALLSIYELIDMLTGEE